MTVRKALEELLAALAEHDVADRLDNAGGREAADAIAVREQLARRMLEKESTAGADELEVFLPVIDSMIEATEEFIADDGLRADEGRIHDLSALLRAREVAVAFHEEAPS